MTDRGPAWPELPLAAWKETYATLHLWTQIVGKIRLAQTPWLNHSWHVVLYVTPRGLTTSPIPFGERTFQLDFDFLDHKLRASESDGGQKEIGLFPLELVLLPTERVPLHIFEERYKELIGECMALDRTFGLVFADERGLREIGTLAAVTAVLERFDDGRLNILAEGRERFRLVALTRGRLRAGRGQRAPP